jgi:hypothetical protein
MRSMTLTILCLACLLAAGPARSQAAAPPGLPVELRDGRGEPITSPLEICFRTDLKSDCMEKIPAGKLLIALSSGRKAPDLHRLAAQPGAVVHLDYQPRDGWSLVLRARSGCARGFP